MKLYYQICLGVLLLLNPSTARLYRRDAYVARRYGDNTVASSGSWDSYQGIESYGWNNRVNPVDEACNICNSFSNSQGMQGYGRPQYGSHHHRENHEKNTYNRPDNYRGNGYDNMSPQWNQRYRPRDKHRPWSSEDQSDWTKVTSSYNGGWSRPNTAAGAFDRKDSYKPGTYPVKVSTNVHNGYWDSHPPREIPWEGDQSNDTRYPGSKNSGYRGSSSGGEEPYQPGAGGYTNDFKPWDQTTKGVSGWDGNGKGIYVASSTPSSGGSSYASDWSGDSQKTSTTTRRPNYSITIEEKPARDQSGYNRPGSSNYIPSGYGDKPASGHLPSGPDQWDRPTSSARPIPVTGYGSTTSSGDTTSWDRPTTTRPSSSYDRPSSSWSRPSSPSSWERPYNRPSNYGKPSISYDKPSSSWSKPADSWDRPVGPHRESSGYGSSGTSIDNAPLGPDNSYIPPGPAYHGTVTTLSPQPAYHEEHPRFPESNANHRPGYENPIPTGSGYDMKRPCSRGGCGGYDRPMVSFGGHGRPSGNRYGNSESNYGQSGSGNSNYDGYGSSHAYGGSSGGHGGYRGGSDYNLNDNRDSWGSGGYNANRGSSNLDSWNSGGYNSHRGGSSGWMNLNSNRGGGYNSGSNSGGHRGSSHGYGGSGNRGGYSDNSSGFGSSSHRYNSDSYGGSNHNDNNYGSRGHQNRGPMHGSNNFNQGGSSYGNNGDDSSSGYGSTSDSDRYHRRPSYGSHPSHMSGGYDYPRPSYMSTSSMRPYEFDRVGHDDNDYSSTYRPDYPSSTGSLDSYSSSTHGPNYDGYGSTTDTSFQPYDQSSSRPFLDYDRDGSLYPSDRYDYSDGSPLQHKHTGLYKVPFYNGHSGVGASTDFGFPTNISSNERDTTTTTTTTVLSDSTTTVSPAN